MTPERWRHVESLFHAARVRAGDERRRFLSEACGEDEDLRAEVDSLLRALDAPTCFDPAAMSRLAVEMASESEDEEPASHPERVGPYRVLEVLGEGGMGTVYLAEQSEPLPRRVALKLVRRGGAHGETLRRFEVEREAMARMSHRAIARVFDAGSTDDGRPYVVLEHIPGAPITEYCDARRLGLRRRLELLAEVCDGVRHAHEKAVLHRDLKPSNILVTDVEGAPHPKIIDFGIAKDLAPWSGSAARTSHSLLVGSLRYVSPEALSTGGRAVDTRSDVYALGVVLCQLIAGVRPVMKPVAAGAERHVRRAAMESARPSRWLRILPAAERRRIARRRRLGERALARRLRPELDWIALRAIAHDPAERYGSAAELAVDIDRWLDGRQIEARPPSAVYRAGKAVRRHAVLVAAALLVASTVVGFSLRSRFLYARAEAARVQAEGLVAFMLDDLSAQLEPMGRLDLLESVSRRSLDYFESAIDGPLEKGGHRPAAALRQIGRVLASRGDLDAANEAYERARGIDETLWRRHPSDPGTRLDLASDLGLLSQVHKGRGELRLAAARADEAERHLRRLVAASPHHVRARLALAETLAGSAEARRLQGDTEAAGALLDESLALARDLERARPDDAGVRHGVGTARYQRGMLALLSRGDVEAAAAEFEAGVEVYRDLARSQPETPLWRHRLAVLLGQGLSSAYKDMARLPAAREANREALELFEALVREESGNGRWRHSLGWELIRRGDLAKAGGDSEAAARAYRRSVEVKEALLARSTGAPTAWLDGLASAYEALAKAESGRGDRAAALAAAEGSLATRQRISGDDAESPYYLAQLATAGVMVGELRARSGDLEGARRALSMTAAVMERIEVEEIAEPYVRTQHAETARRLEALDQSLG